MGKSIMEKLKKNENAAMGIGAMIIFIAMVLVAGIAASVLVQTSTSLEMQALRTAQGTTDEIASGLHVEAVEGNVTTSAINKMAIEIRPRAGSPDIDLSETVIELSDSSAKHILRHSGNTAQQSTSVDGAIFNCTYGTATTFEVIILQDADNSVYSDNVINFGDHVVLAVNTASVFSSNSGILTRTEVDGLIIPEEGAPGIIGFTTPSSYTGAQEIIELQ